jgi:hypothetical protein
LPLGVSTGLTVSQATAPLTFPPSCQHFLFFVLSLLIDACWIMSGNFSSKSPQVRLNGRIISAANVGVEKLLQCVDETVDQMNLVHVSTALHRLARVCSSSNNSVVSDCLVARLMSRLDETCAQRIHWNAKAFGVASIILWAVVALKVPMSASTLTTLRQGIIPGFAVMKPQEISNTVTALHSLQGLTVQAVLAASDAMTGCCAESSHTCLAQVSRAIAEYGFTIQDCRNPMLPILEERVMSCSGTMHQWVPRDTAAAAYALMQGRCRNDRVVNELACAIDKRANHFAAVDVVVMCRGISLFPGTALDNSVGKAVRKAATTLLPAQRKEIMMLCPALCRRAGMSITDHDTASTVLGTDESDTEESEMDSGASNELGQRMRLPVPSSPSAVVPIIQSFPNGNANLVMNPQTGFCQWVTAMDLARAQPMRYED